MDWSVSRERRNLVSCACAITFPKRTLHRTCSYTQKLTKSLSLFTVINFVTVLISRQLTDIRCTYNETVRRFRVAVTYSGYVFVALVIQHVMRMRRIILQSVASQAL